MNSDGTFDGKVVVLGIGNPYMRDDGVGIYAIRYLKENIHLSENMVLFEETTIDLSLLAQFEGASKIIIIDALKAGNPPGTVSKYEIISRKDPLVGLPNLHELQLYDLLDVAKSEFLTCPVVVVGVEPKDVSLGEGLSDVVARAMDGIADQVRRELKHE